MLEGRVAWAVAIVATLTMTVSYVDRTTLAVLAPAVTDALGISEQEYGWLASAFSLAYLVATPLAGWWIDRAGARRGLVWSVLAWSSVAALHALAPGFGVLFALRIALGVTEGPSFPGAAQTVQRVLPPAERARGFGVLFTGSSIGGMIAPPLASALYGRFGWRVAFLGTALVGLLWIPVWIALTRRPAVAAQLEAPDEAAGSDAPVPPRPSFGARPARGSSGAPAVSFGGLVRHPVVIRALVAIFAAAPVLGFLQAWGAKYLVREFGVAQVDVGSYLWLPPLLLDAGAVLFGDLASRQRRAPGAPPRALFAIAASLACCLALLPLAHTPWDAMAIAGVGVAGSGALYTLVTADLLSRMPPGSVSFAGGILAGAQSLSLIIVNPLIGNVVTMYDYGVVAIVLGLWALPGSVIWLLWKPSSYGEPSGPRTSA